MVEQVLGEGIRVGTSADGLTWDMPERLVSALKPDTPKQAYWDPRIGRYVAWLKLMVADDGTPMFPFVDPVDSDPPVIAPKVLYTEAEDAYFMFPMTYQHYGEGETTVRNDGLNDAQFAASRGSIHWMRYDRRPYIGRGLPGTFDGGAIHASPAHLRRGDRFLQMYTGSPWTHGGFRALSDDERRDRGYDNGIGLVEQRLDGFVSADAAYTGGTLTTPPLSFSGERLELNIDVAAMDRRRSRSRTGPADPPALRHALDRALRLPVRLKPCYGASVPKSTQCHKNTVNISPDQV